MPTFTHVDISRPLYEHTLYIYIYIYTYDQFATMHICTYIYVPTATHTYTCLQQLMSTIICTYTYIRCLNIHETHQTHMTANYSTNNNVVFFLVSNLKAVYYNSFKSSITLALTRKRKNWPHYLSGEKTIQN